MIEATLQRVANCGEYIGDNGLVNTEFQVCYSIPGIAAACTGDIGRPIVFLKYGAAVCLMGKSSFIAGRCDHPFYPSAFTSTFAYRSWTCRQIQFLVSGKFRHNNKLRKW